MKKYYFEKNIFDKISAFELRQFLCKFSTFIMRCADTGRSTPTTGFDVVI